MFSFIKKSVINFSPVKIKGLIPYCAEHHSPGAGCPCPSLKGVQDQGKQQLELQVWSLSRGDTMPQEPSGAFNMTCI